MSKTNILNEQLRDIIPAEFPEDPIDNAGKIIVCDEVGRLPITVALSDGSQLDGINGSGLIAIGDLFVSNPGVTTEGSTINSTLTRTVGIDVGFIPKNFEAFLVMDASLGQLWSYNSASSIVTSGILIKGSIGGSVTWAQYTYSNASKRPDQTSEWQINGSWSNAGTMTLGAPGYGSGTTANPGLTASAVISNSFNLSSISLSGTTINFNFTNTNTSPSNAVCLRYGVKYFSAKN